MYIYTLTDCILTTSVPSYQLISNKTVMNESSTGRISLLKPRWNVNPILTSLSVSRTRQIFGGYSNGTVKVWYQEEKPTLVKTLPSKTVSSITAITSGPGSSCVVTGSQTGRVVFTDIESQCQYRFPDMEGPIRSLCVSSKDTIRILSAAKSNLVIFDHRQPKSPYNLCTPFPVSRAAMSETGVTVATGDYSGRVLLWDLRAASPIDQESGLSSTISSLVFSNSGDMLAAGSIGGTVASWFSSGQTNNFKFRTANLKGRSVTSLSFSHCSTWLFAGAEGTLSRISIKNVNSPARIIDVEGWNQNKIWDIAALNDVDSIFLASGDTEPISALVTINGIEVWGPTEKVEDSRLDSQGNMIPNEEVVGGMKMVGEQLLSERLEEIIEVDVDVNEGFLEESLRHEVSDRGEKTFQKTK